MARMLTSLLILVMGLGASEWILRTHAAQMARQDHDNVLARATLMRSHLESALNSTAFRAQGLAAYVQGVDQPSPEQITRALQALHDSDDRIRNVGLAPGNRLTYVYPVRGNEAVLGLQYEKLPEQWPSVERAMRMHQSVLAGPVRLVQGGTALISRTPVYRADDSYWGMISTVIDLPHLLRDVGLSDEVEGVRYWLHGDNGDSAADTRIVGDGTPPDDAVVRMTLEVPGGRWQLTATPVMDAQRSAAAQLPLRVALYAVCLMLAAVTYALMTGRASARLMAERLAMLNHELSATNRELHQLSRHDPLTHLLNRRAFDEAIVQAWNEAARQARPLSVLMIDIDHFKAVNDLHGHAAGDAALVGVAQAIRSQLRRASDLVARYGGEEFIVLTSGLGAAETAALAEAIRRAAAESPVLLPESPASLPVSVSIGTCTRVPMAGERPQTLIARADQALYAAKKAGRNRVVSDADA